MAPATPESPSACVVLLGSSFCSSTRATFAKVCATSCRTSLKCGSEEFVQRPKRLCSRTSRASRTSRMALASWRLDAGGVKGADSGECPRASASGFKSSGSCTRLLARNCKVASAYCAIPSSNSGIFSVSSQWSVCLIISFLASIRPGSPASSSTDGTELESDERPAELFQESKAVLDPGCSSPSSMSSA